ncbi:predicted protein [Arabidopsis lyrata subsp. lyrata]|uniref:Predicted protein n=1 Tax=Arabidopsis lyrata subsp. lyrata TaxID=81972 RepID=D7MAW5_ARALL|nr:predicted protein [Arabidopsis lyrata subsp. lyrata]
MSFLFVIVSVIKFMMLGTNKVMTCFLQEKYGYGGAVGVDKRSTSELQQQGNEAIEGPRRLNLNGGVRIQEPLNVTPLRTAVPSQADDTEKRKATASEKGKGHVTEAAVLKTAHANGLACPPAMEDYYTDPDGPLCLTPRVPIAGRITVVKEIWVI